MASISFAHFSSTGKRVSTNFIIQQIRKLYPDTYYFLASDAVDDHSDLAEKYNLDFHLFPNKIGYPSDSKGYTGFGVAEWLMRLKTACNNTDTSHIMMVEDDVLVIKPITVYDDWEIAAHELNPDGKGNAMSYEVMEIIKVFSGKKPKTYQYGAAGGTIFNVRTFLDNYENVSNFFLEHTDVISNNFYPQIGWIDCFMTVYYMLCGKDYSVNTHVADTHHHKPDFDYDNFVKNVPNNKEIINNYKKFYWTNV